jgi:putative DNA-invertase from lambdoid prophage Rac
MKPSMMPTRTLTAAIYVRVSTQDQNDDMQFTELRQYAERMGWKVVEYAEKMSSVKKRPVLAQLMADARLRKFDVVMVWKLDRFARSLQQLIENIRLLDSFGVRFLAVTQGLDTDKQNPASRLMLHILGAVAEFERGIIVERVRAGVAEAKRQGKHCGRQSRIFRRDEAVELRKQGMSFRKIAAKLELPVSTVVDAIKLYGKSVVDKPKKRN